MSSVSRPREQRTAWFPKLKNESVLFHFYYITSCLLAHCLFGRFFLAFFPLYSEGSDAVLRARGESSPLSKDTSRACAQISTCFIRRVPDPRRV